jgi:hypothetical protein
MILIASIMIIVQSCYVLQKSSGGIMKFSPSGERGSSKDRIGVHSNIVRAMLYFNIIKASIFGESESYKDPVGAKAGIAVPVYNFNDAAGIRAEINGSIQGANYEEANGLKGRVSLFYANFPLVFRYQTPGGFYGEAGIQPGFLLSAKDKYNGITDDYKDFVRKFDFGIPVSVGYEFKNNIGINVRLVRGLTNINTEGDYKDHNFVVGLGVTYTLKNKTSFE